MSESTTATERRSAAPHPGPLVRRDYIETLGIDVARLAAHVRLEAPRLEAMLDGTASFEVDVSIRLARALGLPAERLMQMQNRYDFSVTRADESLRDIGVYVPPVPPAFPSGEFLQGHLGRSLDPLGGEGSLYFQDDVAAKLDTDRYAGFHALYRGDWLRVYGPDQTELWTGPVLQNLDGRILLPYVRTAVWKAWFHTGYRADLAIGAEHAEFFARMLDLEPFRG
jgi:addiction module HigA family antidote